MKIHTFARPSAGALTEAERGAIRGAVRGIWGPPGTKRTPRALLVPAPLDELMTMLPALRHDPALQEASVRVESHARGPAIVLDLRADVSDEWRDRADEPVPEVPAELRRTIERARDRGRSLPAREAALSTPGPKWRKAQR